jgi:hypothetical protein
MSEYLRDFAIPSPSAREYNLQEIAVQGRHERIVVSTRAWVAAPRHLLADYSEWVDPAFTPGLAALTESQLVFVAERVSGFWGSWTLAIPYDRIGEMYWQTLSAYKVIGIRPPRQSVPPDVTVLLLKGGEKVGLALSGSRWEFERHIQAKMGEDGI